MLAKAFTGSRWACLVTGRMLLKEVFMLAFVEGFVS